MVANCRGYLNKLKLVQPEDAPKVLNEKEQKAPGRKKQISMYFLKQKLSGAVMIGSGILVPFINDGDVTATLIIVPVGIYLLITKKKVMDS